MKVNIVYARDGVCQISARSTRNMILQGNCCSFFCVLCRDNNSFRGIVKCPCVLRDKNNDLSIRKWNKDSNQCRSNSWIYEVDNLLVIQDIATFGFLAFFSDIFEKKKNETKSYLFNGFVCQLGFFWYEWARLKRECNERFKGPRVPKKVHFTQKRVEYNVFLFDEPLKGSKWLKIFKINLTFRFDKLSYLSKSVHIGENSQILTVSNKKTYLYSYYVVL
jgi:hypothetical protein